jgi:uncharacterized protein YoxC
MSSSAEILVIILSMALAVFLVLGIVLIIYLIILTRQIRNVASSAERTIESVESVATGISRVITPIYMGEMIAKIFSKIKKSKGEK